MSEMMKKAIASPAVGDDPLVYVMSDETVDRVGDVIKADGWQIGNFLKNPIALFGHDHKFIVGHWTDVKVQGKRLIGRLNLLPKGISERLDEIRAAVEAGVLRAVSVGFNIDPDEAEPRKNGGYFFKSTELLECSLVSVPANPNALQVAKSLDLSDEARALIFTDCAEPDPEIPAEPTEPAATGKKTVVVKLDAPARDRAPFVINKIHPAKPAGR
jgi:HK97 family phage prohead protease